MTNNILSFAVIAGYLIVTHFLIESVMDYLWKRIGKKRTAHILTATLGFIDRIIYALSFAFQAYTFIGIWLGIKIASRLVGYTAITGENKFKEEGERRNVYLIGNIFSLVLGLGGGLLVKFLYNTPISNLLKFLK